jgi:hypothetical protein
MTSTAASHRLLAVLLFAALVGLLPAGAVEAKRGKKVVVHGPRRTVVVHKSFPLKRRLPAVVVRPARTRVAFVTPARYLPVFVWAAPVVVVPARERIVWEDSETFTEDEEWTELSLGVNDSGTAILLDLDGAARFDFAEIVFRNGDVQVVDFKQKKVKRGSFELLNFRNGREVSYVRLIAKAESETARVTLRMIK